MSKEDIENRIQEIRVRLLADEDGPDTQEEDDLKAELHDLELKLV